MWKTDTDELMIKIKNTNVNYKGDMIPKNLYDINLEFKYYSFKAKDEIVSGYSNIVSKVNNDTNIEISFDDDDDFNVNGLN